MKEQFFNKNDFITWEQELLLKAILLHGNDAIAAWKEWKGIIDFDKIDPGSYRLLPLLYNNLIKNEVKDKKLDMLKGIYRRTWFENQILSYQVVKILDIFNNSGIKTLVLKGIALINIYYRDYGLRPMSDIDILIPTEKAADAFIILKKLGWSASEYKSPEKIMSIIHSCDLTDSTGTHHVDLHWHLFIECCQQNADDDFWEGGIKKKIKDVPTHVLNQADQLLHTCVHGMKWSIIPPFRWVADAMIIINSSQNRIDWNRLISQAKKRRLSVPLRYALEYLHKTFNADIPTEVLKNIRKVPTTKIERIEFKYKLGNQKKNFFGNIPVLLFDSLRLSENKSLKQKLNGFIKYMLFFWDLDYPWQLPTYVLSLSFRKILFLTNYNRKP
ncbi:MAG: hypothetical protein EHM47_10720 [Ignavibacteriales bacterium]|nr:MAG: hypothetical protein EHM47_10720 [Ignavibacteriales bacterium]